MNYFNEILEINKKIIPEEDNIRINKEEINENMVFRIKQFINIKNESKGRK